MGADRLRVLVTVPVKGPVAVGLRDDEALNVGSADRVGVFVEDDDDDVEPVLVLVRVSFADALELPDDDRSGEIVAVVELLPVVDAENVKKLLLDGELVEIGDVDDEAVALFIAD
jgi:hypothetical protein